MNTAAPEQFIPAAIDRAMATGCFSEVHDPAGGPNSPRLSLHVDGDTSQSAGWLRYWTGTESSPFDRMVCLHLVAGPALTQLLFVFGRPENTFPHMHAQVVGFPGGLVYNVDLLPRVDAIDDFAWFERVFAPLRRPYRRAVSNSANSCAQAPANPLLATLMSPWGIASQRTNAEEFARVEPQLREYIEHYFSLCDGGDWAAADPAGQAQRDTRHLSLFFSDELDPRAWNGVYKIVGTETGHTIKQLMADPA
jgi:hypothetical protein